MLASTNRETVLDSALLRPGRFDRQIMINLPTLPERKAIFEVYLQDLVLEQQVENDSSRLAALTPGHSGEGCGLTTWGTVVRGVAFGVEGCSLGSRNSDNVIPPLPHGQEQIFPTT